MGKSRTPAKTKGGVPSTDLYDFGEEHEGGGFEGQSRDEKLIPFIEIIHSLTPPEKKKKRHGIIQAQALMKMRQMREPGRHPLVVEEHKADDLPPEEVENEEKAPPKKKDTWLD